MSNIKDYDKARQKDLSVDRHSFSILLDFLEDEPLSTVYEIEDDDEDVDISLKRWVKFRSEDEVEYVEFD